MKYQALVVVEFRNAGSFVYRVTSDRLITVKRLVDYLHETEGFNEEWDSITMVDGPADITDIKI